MVLGFRGADTVPSDVPVSCMCSHDNVKHIIVALELLCSISSFAGFKKRGVKVVSLLISYFNFCILTAGFKVHRIPNPSLCCVVIDFFL